MSELAHLVPTPASDAPISADGAKRDVFHDSVAESELTPAAAEPCAMVQGVPECTDPAPASAAKPLPVQQIRTWDANPDLPTLPDAAIPARLGFDDLSEKQVQALDLMFCGMRLSQIATTLQVHRNTLHRWRTQHPAFIAAYNRRHKEHLDAASVRIAQLLDASLTQFEAIFAGEKAKPRRILAAHRILKTFASRRLLQGPGPTNPPAVLRHLALQRRAELCAPLTNPVTQDELDRVLDELQYELRDIVINKYSHATNLPAPAPQPTETSPQATGVAQ